MFAVRRNTKRCMEHEHLIHLHIRLDLTVLLANYNLQNLSDKGEAPFHHLGTLPNSEESGISSLRCTYKRKE